jgi:hypothetical protein
MGRSEMMWMDWWMSPRMYERQLDRGSDGPPTADLVSQADTWGFSTASATRAVRGRPWTELTTGWRASTERLLAERLPGRQLALVLLRAALLDEMEAQRPQAFTVWLSEQVGHRRPRA